MDIELQNLANYVYKLEKRIEELETEKPIKLRDIPQGAGSRLDADTWRNMTPTGLQTTITNLTNGTQTTVGAAGGATALPATPTGYIIMTINGTSRVIPFYAAS